MKNDIEKKVSGRQVLLTLCIWILLSILAGTGTFYALRSVTPGWATVDNQSVTIVAEVYFLFIVSVAIVFSGFRGLADSLNFKFTSIGDIWLSLKWYCIVLVVCVMVYLLLGPFIGPLPKTLLQILRHASDMSRLSSAGFIGWLLIIIRACFLAPITEELLFRGLLFGWLRPRFSAPVTILITTIPFTCMHYYLILFPIALLFGITSGWIRERTGSSLNFVIAHVANSVLFLLSAYIIVTYFKV